MDGEEEVVVVTEHGEHEVEGCVEERLWEQNAGQVRNPFRASLTLHMQTGY